MQKTQLVALISIIGLSSFNVSATNKTMPQAKKANWSERLWRQMDPVPGNTCAKILKSSERINAAAQTNTKYEITLQGIKERASEKGIYKGHKVNRAIERAEKATNEASKTNKSARQKYNEILDNALQQIKKQTTKITSDMEAARKAVAKAQTEVENA